MVWIAITLIYLALGWIVFCACIAFARKNNRPVIEKYDALTNKEKCKAYMLTSVVWLPFVIKSLIETIINKS